METNIGSNSEHLAIKPHVEYPHAIKNEGPESRAQKLWDWARNHLHYTALFRMRKFALWRLADLFFDSDQTGNVPANLGYAGETLSRLLHPDPIYLGEDMPSMPTFNEFKDAILNEASRLDNSDYAPTVRPEGDDPGYEQRMGAKIATRALQSELERLGWEHKKRVAATHLPMYGGAWIVSSWEQSMEDTVRIPVRDCSECPQCGTKYAGPQYGGQPVTQCMECVDHEEQRPPDEAETAGRLHDAFMQMDVMPEMATPDMLPPEAVAQIQAPITYRAPGAPATRPYTPAGPELGMTDPLGNPFGEDVPLGQWLIEIPWPGDVFEADFGAGQPGDQEVKDVTFVRIRSRDWARARYKNARDAGDKLRAENQTALMEYHPVNGDLALTDERFIWRDHLRVVTRIKWPWMEAVRDENGQHVYVDGKCVYRLNRGKVVTIAGGIVMEDQDLMLEGPDGRLFPRIKVTYTPFDLASGDNQREGSSLSKTLFDAQRLINWSGAMDVDEQRNGQSRWLTRAGADVHFENAEGTSMQVVVWDAPEGVDTGDYKPELISRPTDAMKYGSAAEYGRAFMERASRRTDVEGGNLPSPTTAASAMQIAREESSALRKPRIEALGKTYERVLRHGLQLMQHYVHEPRVAWDKTDSKEEFQVWWTGADFSGQTDVRIDVEGAQDTELFRQSKYDDAMKGGLVDMMDPRVRRIMGKLKGVPNEVYEAEDAQVKVAEREYLEFTRGVDLAHPEAAGGLVFGPAPVVDDGLDDHVAHALRHKKDMHSDLWRQLEKLVRWDEVLPMLHGWKAQLSGLLSQPGGLEALPMPPQQFVLNLWVQMLSAQGVQPDPVLLGVLAFRAHLADHELKVMSATMQAQAAAAPPGGEGASAAPGGGPPQAGAAA